MEAGKVYSSNTVLQARKAVEQLRLEANLERIKVRTEYKLKKNFKFPRLDLKMLCDSFF